jgi:hypothetical protein
MRSADLRVARRWEVRGEKVVRGGGKADGGMSVEGDAAEWMELTDVECVCIGLREKESTLSWERRFSDVGRGAGADVGLASPLNRFSLFGLAFFVSVGAVELALLLAVDADSTLNCDSLFVFPVSFNTPPSTVVGVPTSSIGSSTIFASSSLPTHKSHTHQPITVPVDPTVTTPCGLTRSWYIDTKHTMKITTAQTCCTMTVESATNGQKSYGNSLGLRCSCSRNVS